MNRQKASQDSDNRPIGVFDSGVGGLTVVKQLMRYLPHENIVYYGDTARVPYGTKSRNTIIKFSIENALFLLKHNVKLIVVACNTSSSVSLPALRRNFKVPVIGVIKPGACDGVKACKNKRLGIIATPATIKSNAYAREISRIDSSVKTFSASCPLLVPVAEEGLKDSRITLDIIKYYMNPIKQKSIDTLILGCTHYPILKGLISSIMGKSISLVDSAESTAKTVRCLLSENSLLAKRRSPGKLKFFVSDEIENFKRVGEKFIGQNLNSIRRAGYGI
jgi:glutamate racemase